MDLFRTRCYVSMSNLLFLFRKTSELVRLFVGYGEIRHGADWGQSCSYYINGLHHVKYTCFLIKSSYHWSMVFLLLKYMFYIGLASNTVLFG